MKPRPRSAERRVAELLSDFFISIGASPVERIPVLGRTGPDLTINEIGLVVDVKSRLEVPVTYIWSFPRIHNGLAVIPLGILDMIIEKKVIPNEHKHHSVQVDRWFAHMDEWTKVHKPDGITALVLHRPKVPFGISQLIIRYSQLPILEERCQLMKSQSTSPVRTLN
jgi:hypothetical protein